LRPRQIPLLFHCTEPREKWSLYPTVPFLWQRILSSYFWPRKPFQPNFGRGCGLLPLPASTDKPLCQVCKKRCHEALDCWYRFDNEIYPSPPQAYFNTTSSTSNERWFLDSGVSHHVTSDLNNLTSFHAYDGQDCLLVGNDSHRPIHNLGYYSLSSLNGSLDLNGVLHVPHITKNLISISKLTQDNNVILKFHPLFCKGSPHEATAPSSSLN
jgi:hypothetical protein